MGKKMTLRKIAAELEISQVTVFRALSGRSGVSVKLREKILRTANRYKYELPNHRTGNIAIVVPDVYFSGYLSMLVLNLNRALHKKGFCCYIVTEYDVRNLSDYLFDGLICTTWYAGFEKKFPRDHVLPVVCVNAKDNRLENIHKVAMDETGGIRAGMQLLYRSGCRRIYFSTPRDSDPAVENVCREERVKAYCDFCKEHDIFDEDLLWNGQCGSAVESTVEWAIAHQADAIFHTNEDQVSRVYECLRKHGKRIPEDISVLGLELDSCSEFMNPPLTTLRQNFERLAECGVGMLVRLINKEEVPEEIRIPYQVIKRNSIRNKQNT